MKRRRAETIAADSNASPVKRGRGRPRKNALPAMTQDALDRELPGDFSDNDDELAMPALMQRDQDSGSEDEIQTGDATHVATGSEAQETPKRRPGRPKGSRAKRQKSPSPPTDMPAYEQYFFQNRPGGVKTSNSTLSSMDMLTHEGYYDAMQRYQDPHQDDMDYLHHLHSRAFDQWLFELQEGFSICLYGWGSKRLLLSAFADHIASELPETPKIVVVNGFNPSLGIRDILSTVASCLPSLRTAKLGAQPADMLSTILAALSSEGLDQAIHVLIHSMDSPSLRRTSTQSILARLSQHHFICLAFTADSPMFPLLWDARLRSQLNVLFHDATSFQPFSTEISVSNGGGGIVDEVNSLLGRSGRRVHGREGVVFVLRSLTESARRLFGLLVSEVLSADEADLPDTNAAANNDNEFEQALTGATPGARQAHGGGGGGAGAGIEYRAFYRKAVQQLVTSSEVSFRQLLKEFHDHEMLVSRRDASGTEILALPFRRDECEAILEDLVVDDN